MSAFSAILAGTGSFLPEKRLTNDELSTMVETSNDWIVQRTGIRERRIVENGQTTASLAVAAARNAIEAAGIEANQIGLILVATCTPEMMFPSTACFVGAELGIPGTPGFDLAAACSGFLFGLSTATSFIRSGQYEHVLVIGAETLSRVTDFTDRGSCIIFGDGAGAAVLSRSTDAGRGVIYNSMHSDGRGGMAMQLRPGSRHPVNQAMLDAGDQYMKIKGREVYKFAVETFVEQIEDAVHKTNLTYDQVKYIIPHQVNQRIIDSAMEKLALPPEKAYVNIDRYGNTSAASIPIALDEAMRANKIAPGDNLVFVAFGGGLTWANAVVTM